MTEDDQRSIWDIVGDEQEKLIAPAAPILHPWQRPTPMQELMAKPPSELVRNEDPETSHAAARALAGKAGTMRRTLLNLYSAADLIAEEASEEAGYTAADGAWKRVSDLLGAGLLEDTGQTRLASTGRHQRVLRITQAGREALT